MRAPGGTPSRAQLPPGRHGLPRSFVAQNQRDRILAAVADVTSAASYAEMTVADIIACAGVSRRTFYEHFQNKQSAYLAAYDEASGRLLEGVRWAYSSQEDFADAGPGRRRAVRHGPGERGPGLCPDVPGGGDGCRGRGAASAGRRDGGVRRDARRERPRPCSTTRPRRSSRRRVVGGLYEVIYSRIVRGELRELPGLLPELVHALLLPYLGPERALRSATGSRARASMLDVPALGGC